MKIKEYQISNTLTNFDKYQIILIHGPDQGLVNDRYNTLIKNINIKFNNSINIKDLDINDVINDKSIIYDNCMQTSLLAQINIVRIKINNDKIIKSIDEFLKTDNKKKGFVIILSENLPPSSSIRRLIEKDACCACIACYQDDALSIINTINELCEEYKIAIDNDAKNFLSTRLGNDRGITRQELIKLSIYKNSKNKNISYQDVINSIGDRSLITIDKLCDSLVMKNSEDMFNCLDLLIKDGTNVITIIRSLLNHFLKILQIKISDNPQLKIKQIKPAFHFKRLSSINLQVNKLSLVKLENILITINKLEIMCKSNYKLAEVYLRQALLSISQKN